MRPYNFSRNEIDRLYQIRKILEDEYENLPDNSPDINFDTPIDEAQQFINEYLEGRERYNERFDIFKYQIFALVAENDWEQRLEEWKINICSNSESAYNYRRNVFSLSVWFYHLIPLTASSTAYRTFDALIDEFGYEKAIEIIKLYSASEKNLQLKSEFEEFIADDDQIIPHKQELHSIFRDKNLYHRLNLLRDKLMESGNTKDDIINLLRTSILLIDGDRTNKIEDKENLTDNIANYIEILQDGNDN